MDDFKSFVYQIKENPRELIPAKCIVHFRPHKGWDGTGYGFDWMRESDTKVFGDKQPYINIVGHQYNKNGSLVTDINEYKGTFKTDYSLYRQLEQVYNPMLMIAKPIKPPLAIPVYYCSWLSIFPPMIIKPAPKLPYGCILR